MKTAEQSRDEQTTGMRCIQYVSLREGMNSDSNWTWSNWTAILRQKESTTHYAWNSNLRHSGKSNQFPTCVRYNWDGDDDQDPHSVGKLPQAPVRQL